MTKSSRFAFFFVCVAFSWATPAQTTPGAPVLIRPLQSSSAAAARRATLMQQREIQLRKSDNTEQLRREAATMRRGNAPATPAEKSQRALYEASRQRAVESYWGTALPAAAPPPSPDK